MRPALRIILLLAVMVMMDLDHLGHFVLYLVAGHLYVETFLP